MIDKIFSFIINLTRTIDKCITIGLFFANNQAMAYYLRRWNIAKVGKNTWIATNVRFDLFKNKYAQQLHRPIITIGNNCIITEYVQMITHDTSYAYFCSILNKPGKKKWGEIIVEDNVFIGAGCIILPGVTIHKNSLIGAGSVVTKNVESNSVYAGNPAKRLMSIEEYIKKVQNSSL